MCVGSSGYDITLAQKRQPPKTRSFLHPSKKLRKGSNVQEFLNNNNNFRLLNSH